MVCNGGDVCCLRIRYSLGVTRKAVKESNVSKVYRQTSLWQNAAVSVLAHQTSYEPATAARAAIAYADALMVEIAAQTEKEQQELRAAEEAELSEVRARFPLGSLAKCLWGTAPVVKVERGSLHNRGKITVSIFSENRHRGGSGITLPHTEFTPVTMPTPRLQND